MLVHGAWPGEELSPPGGTGIRGERGGTREACRPFTRPISQPPGDSSQLEPKLRGKSAPEPPFSVHCPGRWVRGLSLERITHLTKPDLGMAASIHLPCRRE